MARIQLQAHLRNTLLAGALAAIPVVVAIFIFSYADGKTREAFGVEHSTAGVAVAVVLSILALYILGLFVTSLIGQFLLGATDAFMHRIPGVRDLYRAWKQVALTTAKPEGIFARVVLVPDESGWMRVLGFSSGRPIDGDPGVCCVFVPASPNPTSGRLFFVPVDTIIPVDLPPHEAFKVIISSGNYVPAALGAATSGQGPLSRPITTS